MEKRIAKVEELAGVAQAFLADYPDGAVVGLSGELGAGKTTFVRQCVAILATRMGKTIPRVISPSFVLHQSYAMLVPPVEHFDLYRLQAITDATLLELGYFETVDRCRTAKGYVFVEWPEHATERGILGLDTTIAVELMGEGRTFRWR